MGGNLQRALNMNIPQNEYMLKQRGHHKNGGPQIQAKGIDSKPKLLS